MSCLFNSLSHFLNGVTSTQLREIICNYMKQNPKIMDDTRIDDVIKWENGNSIEDYLSNMEKTSTWGGGIEIKCFCEIYSIRVLVNFNNRKIEFLPASLTSVKTIELCYTGNHYEPK